MVCVDMYTGACGISETHVQDLVVHKETIAESSLPSQEGTELNRV